MSWQSSEKKQKIINNHNKQGEMEAAQTCTQKLDTTEITINNTKEYRLCE